MFCPFVRSSSFCSVNHGLITLFALFLTAIVYGQENCFDGVDNDGDGFIDLNDPEGCTCSESSQTEFVINGDFETFDACPNGFSQLGVATGFYISQGGTTDYYNTCGYTGGDLYPEVAPILEPQNGDGIVGFFSENAELLNYREYVSTCLNTTLIPGETYTLSFEIATTGQISSNEIGGIDFLECSALSFGLFGSTNCPLNLGGTDFIGCITDFSAEYFNILEEEVNVEINQFTTYTFTFTVPEATNNIVFGGGCNESICTGQGLNAYFYLDNLSITSIGDSEVPTPQISVSGNSCQGFSLVTDNPIYENYQWFLEGVALDGETNPTLNFEADNSPTITLGVLQDVDGESICAFSNPVTLTAEPDILLNADFPEVLCPNELGEIALDILPDGNYDIEWNTGNDTQTIEAEIGAYSVLVTNTETGCFNSLELEIINCEDIGIQIGLDNLTVCLGESATIEAEVSGGVPPYSFNWIPALGSGPGPFAVLATEETSYSLTVTDADGNIGEESISLSVIDPDNFNFDLGPDTAICSNEVIEISPVPIIEGGDYTWSTGENVPVILINQPGTYLLSVETACGNFENQISVDAKNDPDFPNIPREFFICEDEPLTITIPQDQGFTASWETGETAIERTFSESGQFSITFESECRSQTKSFSTESVDCECEIYIPNAFSPNQDGLNDVFKVSIDCEVESYSLRIFNRWGENVFSSISPAEPWLGTFNDGDFFNGVTIYNYILEVQPSIKGIIADPIVRRGSITTVR